MKNLLLIAFIFASSFCFGQNSNSSTVGLTGQRTQVYGFIQSYPTVDTICWYLNKEEVETYVQSYVTGFLPQIVKTQQLLAQTSIDTVTSYTTTDTGTFVLYGTLDVTAIATNVIRWQITYTDIHSNVITAVTSFTPQISGTATNLASVSATGSYGVLPYTIRAMSGTTIYIATINSTGGGTNTFDVGATIVRISN